MNIDIEKINWKKFQDLCTDILKEEGFIIVRRSGVGSDRGMDIIVKKEVEFAPGLSKPFVWLVQCKHKSKKGSLYPNEVGDFISDLPRHNANGYWLITNAYLATSLEDKITFFNANNSYGYSATYSNGKDIGDFIYKYRNLLKKYSTSDQKIVTQKIDWRKINPYKELQAYSEADKDFFFGRNEEIEEVLSKIYRYKIIGLFGESGTGKTSLINAGLLPNLKVEGFLVVLVRCLDEPIKRIRESLLTILKNNDISNSLIERISIADSFPHLISELKFITEKGNLNMIICIDQFEELFTRANENEREQLGKGILESLIQVNSKGKICFLLSLREDYIGHLWDWSHRYNLEDAWIQTYRISRFNEDKAHQSIVEPLNKFGIATNKNFIENIVKQLKAIGEGFIYPPYLQILCSNLFEAYKHANSGMTTTAVFDKKLLTDNENVQTIISEFLSESMLDGLTEEEKVYAENILNVLTGSEGLRAFLTIDDIARYISTDKVTAQHVVEHLTKKKIVHPVVEKDKVNGYELVHDFLSKKFFEKLGPEAKKSKTIIEIFRKAFKEWNDHKVLASKDRLKLFAENINQLVLNNEEWLFLIKSGFSVYWFDEGRNKLLDIIAKERLVEICKSLLNDKDLKIAQEAIRTLGKLEGKEVTHIFKAIIESLEVPVSIREAAVDQFWWNIIDIRILDTLKYLIREDKEYRIRKSAVYGYAKNLSQLFKLDKGRENIEIEIIYEALNDNRAQVRKQAADVLGYILVNEKSVKQLILRLEKETSIQTRKSIVYTLGSLSKKEIEPQIILKSLNKISKCKTEDYRVKEEANLALKQFEELQNLTSKKVNVPPTILLK